MSDFINLQKRCDALDRINNTMGKIKLIQELASHPESVAALNHRHRLDLDAVAPDDPSRRFGVSQAFMDRLQEAGHGDMIWGLSLYVKE